jgi:hypothetical protein
MTLVPADEGLHSPPESAPERWQENFFFICWDTAGGHGLLLHLQRVPGSDVQEAQLAVSVGGKLASASFVAPFAAAATPFELSMEATVPFRQWRLEIEGRGHRGRGPLGFLATRPGGDVAIAVELTLDSELEVADFASGLEAVVAEMRSERAGPQMGSQQHYEQGGTWKGRLRIGDDTVEATGLFVRDHSWGVRHEHQNFVAFWTASCLDGGRLFCNAIGIPSGGRVIGVGVVVDECGSTFTNEVAASFHPEPGLLSYEDATVDFGEEISRTLHASTLVHIPIHLPHSGPRRYDNNAISTVEMDGKSGFGVIEWAAVLDETEDAQLHPQEVRS